MISVCVNTRDRPEALKQCLQSILKNRFQDFEIIIIDQSTIYSKIIDHPKIRYFRDRHHGTGKAKNLAISKALGNIISFTDDDCVVPDNWLELISSSFNENADIKVVFGKVLPYKPLSHVGKICPCIFENRRTDIIRKPCLHSRNIGFGNNMAFKRDLFEKIGGFKEWLGPGSIGQNAEDAEYAQRVLLNNYQILYNPKVKVHHNRWLTGKESSQQSLVYLCGEMACYGYLGLGGLTLGKEVVTDRFHFLSAEIFASWKRFIKLEGQSPLVKSLQKVIYASWGLILALVYSYLDPDEKYPVHDIY